MFSSDGKLKITRSREGQGLPFDVTPKIRERLQQLGVFQLGSLLKKKPSKLTDFERRLLDGVHWCALAQVQRLPEIRLLSLVTALETILNPHGNRPIRTGIAEGVALLLGNSLEQRKKLRDFVGRLYDLRSRVSHGGHPEVLQCELRDLRNILANVILLLLDDIESVKKQKELLEKLDDLRLSGDRFRKAFLKR